MPSRQQKEKPDPISGDNAIRVGLTSEQKKKLHEMSTADRRKYGDFLRQLIEQEWDRRKVTASAA